MPRSRVSGEGLLVFEAAEAVAAAEELEHTGRQGRTDGAEGLQEELKGAVQRLLAYLEAAVGGLTEPRTGWFSST